MGAKVRSRLIEYDARTERPRERVCLVTHDVPRSLSASDGAPWELRFRSSSKSNRCRPRTEARSDRSPISLGVSWDHGVGSFSFPPGSARCWNLGDPFWLSVRCGASLSLFCRWRGRACACSGRPAAAASVVNQRAWETTKRRALRRIAVEIVLHAGYQTNPGSPFSSQREHHNNSGLAISHLQTFILFNRA